MVGWLLAVLLGAAQAAPLTVTLDARAMEPGELVIVTAVTASPVDALRVSAFDRQIRPYRVDQTTWRALVGIDLDVAPGSYPVIVTVPDGQSPPVTGPLVVIEKKFPTRTLEVDPAFVNPPSAVQKRIAEEAAELGRIWRHSSAERFWSDAFVRPVPQRANSAFGTRSVFNGEARSPHSGADFRSPAGTPIRAPNAGRVVLARDLYYTGGTVAIDHGLGLVSLFAHLSSIEVHVGDVVTVGQIVGKVGATGRVTGAHLHWTVRADGARIDPLSLLAVLGAR